MLRLFLMFSFFGPLTETVTNNPRVVHSASNSKEDVAVLSLYKECGLEKILNFDAFKKCMQGFEKYKPPKTIVAICDFSKPSDQKRFFVVDIKCKKLLAYTYVAHGKNSGEKMATCFSNQPESLKSSLGFFKIGQPIATVKHGMSLILDGLERGINDNARTREIIIHGASYVSEQFVKQYGYTGKSFGCPALPQDVMKEMLPVLANGGLLFIYTH